MGGWVGGSVWVTSCTGVGGWLDGWLAVWLAGWTSSSVVCSECCRKGVSLSFKSRQQAIESNESAEQTGQNRNYSDNRFAESPKSQSISQSRMVLSVLFIWLESCSHI